MRKTVAAILTIIAAAIIGIPPLIGNFTERRVVAQVELTKAMTDKAYDLEILEYNSGWFGSTALVEVNLDPEQVQQIVDTVNQEDVMAATITAMVVQSFLDKSMPIEIEIGHGPIIFGNGLQFGILSSVIRIAPNTNGLSKLLNTLGIPYLFEAHTLAGFTGVLGFTGAMPPIEVASGNTEISFSGFNIEGSYDILARQIGSIVNVGSLRANAPGIGAVVIEDVLLTVDGANHPSILWLGKIATNIANVTINGTTPRGPFNLAMMNAGANFDTATDDQGDLISIEGSYYVNSFQSPDNLDLTLARINFGFSNFSREAIEKYLAYSQLVADDPRTAPPLIPGIQDMLYLTLVTSPTIQIGPTTFLWQGEPFDADLRLTIDGSVLPPQAEFSMLDIRTITSSITATGFADMSPELAETLVAESIKYQMKTGGALNGNQIPENDLNTIADLQAIGMLLGLVAQGILVESDAGYRSVFKFENRELIINGNVFPIGLPL